MTLKEYDTVYLRRPLPEHSLLEGAIGTIVMVYKAPPGYEVEFCDKEGVTLALVSVSQEEADETICRIEQAK